MNFGAQAQKRPNGIITKPFVQFLPPHPARNELELTHFEILCRDVSMPQLVPLAIVVAADFDVDVGVAMLHSFSSWKVLPHSLSLFETAVYFDYSTQSLSDLAMDSDPGRQ